MYPTLLELCGLPPNPENDGRSFVRLLANPSMVGPPDAHDINSRTVLSLTAATGAAPGVVDGTMAESCMTMMSIRWSTPTLRLTQIIKVIARLREHVPTRHEPNIPDPRRIKKQSDRFPSKRSQADDRHFFS